MKAEALYCFGCKARTEIRLIPRHPKCACGAKGVRDDRFDAYYCPKSGVWLEAQCPAESTCSFCRDRPRIHLDPIRLFGPLKDLFGEGFPRPNVTLIVGHAGVGKTTLGLQLIEAMRTREVPTVIATEESAENLATLCKRLRVARRLRLLAIKGSVGSASGPLFALIEDIARSSQGPVMLDSLASVPSHVSRRVLLGCLKAVSIRSGMPFLVIDHSNKQGLYPGDLRDRADMALWLDFGRDGTHERKLTAPGQGARHRMTLTDRGFTLVNTKPRRPSKKR